MCYSLSNYNIRVFHVKCFFQTHKTVGHANMSCHTYTCRCPLPDISWGVLRKGVVRAGQNLDDGSRVVSLEHLHRCGVHRLLETQLDVVLAVKSFRGASERWRCAGTLFPPRPIGSEYSRLGEVSRAGVDVGYACQVPHSVGHAVLAAIMGTEVQNLFGILLHFHTDWQNGPLARLHGPPTGQCLATSPAPGASPQTDIIKHAQKS